MGNLIDVPLVSNEARAVVLGWLVLDPVSPTVPLGECN